MQAIESGSTTERIVRNALMLVLINGFAAAYLWDGYVGYAWDNAQVLVESLGLSDAADPVIYEEITASRSNDLMARWNDEARTSILGELSQPSLKHGEDLYFLGPGGHLRIQADNARLEWVNGKHTETDLAWQRGIGFALLVPGIICLFHFVRLVLARVRVDESGLKAPGVKVIPFNAVTAVERAETRSGTGVTIAYVYGARRRSVHLDDYRVRAYGEIVAAVCSRTGLPNPLERAESASQAELPGSSTAEK